AAPLLASLVKDVNNDVARAALHGIVAAALTQMSGGSGSDGMKAGAIGAITASAMTDHLVSALYGKDVSQLTADEKRLVSSLVTIAGGLAGAAGTDGDLSMAAIASSTAKVEVLNNSTSGDNARDSVKQSAEHVKDKIRDTLGNGTTSSIANGIVNALADSGDSLIGGADYVADTAMALASCATGDSYCDKALSDLAGKNQAAADSVKALMKTETWSALANNVKQAYGGNQAALEGMGGIIASIFLPGKKLPDVGGIAKPSVPKITIRDHYEHHTSMVTDVKDQLTQQGYDVSLREASFGSSCSSGRCRPDIIAKSSDGSIRIIEIKTGDADLSIRQSEIYPQISNGDSIPRGKVAK
ncbi:TPA: VENN motif pre-toxin domain-containing protein, partial [Citrobacter pasteurii]